MRFLKQSSISSRLTFAKQSSRTTNLKFEMHRHSTNWTHMCVRWLLLKPKLLSVEERSRIQNHLRFPAYQWIKSFAINRRWTSQSQWTILMGSMFLVKYNTIDQRISIDHTICHLNHETAIWIMTDIAPWVRFWSWWIDDRSVPTSFICSIRVQGVWQIVDKYKS